LLFTLCPKVLSQTLTNVPARARFLLEWGRKGSAPSEFNFPIGIAINRKGELFVTDFYNARVQRFNPGGKLLSTFPVQPNPGGLAIDGNGDLYITHFSAMANQTPKPDHVSVVTSTGKLIRQWGRTGTGDGEFDYPGGIAISAAGRVYVADQTNRRVQVFDKFGKFLFKWGQYGTKPGEFGGNISIKSRVGGPQFLAIDKSGCVYTTEGSMGRIQKFTADGEFLSAWGENGDAPGGFGGGYAPNPGSPKGPIGICLDEHGAVWISSASGRVQQYTTSGRYLQSLQNALDARPGPFVAPHGLVLDGRGGLFVVDAFNHRIVKFNVGR